MATARSNALAGLYSALEAVEHMGHEAAIPGLQAAIDTAALLQRQLPSDDDAFRELLSSATGLRDVMRETVLQRSARALSLDDNTPTTSASAAPIW